MSSDSMHMLRPFKYKTAAHGTDAQTVSLMVSMFSSSNLPVLSISYTTTTPTAARSLRIQCGSRDGRPPLQKGRILSTQALQAIQSLKLAKSSPPKLNQIVSQTLPRLVKNDLIASLYELLRQNHCDLALTVFSIVRSEFWYKPDCSLYAEIVSALARNGMEEEIDGLMVRWEEDGFQRDDRKGIGRLIKALVKARSKDLVVRIYGVMRSGGWVCRDDYDDYVVGVLSRGFRIMGEEMLAQEVEMEFQLSSPQD